MEGNIYSPPTANLSSEEDETEKAYYVVSKKKFLILYFGTLGIYKIYWFYRNWKLYKLRTGDNVWPVPRGIFNIFFVHALFESIDHFFSERGKSSDREVRGLASMVVFFILAVNLTDRLMAKGIGLPYTGVLHLLSMGVVGFVLSLVQSMVNDVCDDASGETNDKLTIVNYLWIAAGMFLWLGMIYILIHPEA